MKHVQLGRAAVQVSRLCLGTMNFGPETDEATSGAIMDRALEHGLDFFDTADVYGWKLGEGVTEQILGRWFAQGGGRRERVVLATKVYGKMGDGPNDARLSARHIRAACEASLRRLRTDHLDLYQMHHVAEEATWEEIWQAMELLVQQGKVLYVGSSNFAAWHIARANEAAGRRRFLGLVSEQSIYHLNTRTVELEVLPCCLAYGVGVIPWSPLGGGLLGGVLARQAREGRRGKEAIQKRIERHRSQLERWEDLCRELGHDPAQVALAWLLAQPAVTAPIVGPRTPEQLDALLPALEIRLSPEALAKIDEIWPGPGGKAPQAYAW
jgi:aryl-alcohol dehydrogenase-like predicted oxidoreductase